MRGKRIDLTQPRGGGLTSLGNREQVDVRRHLGRVDVFAAAAIAHGRAAQGEPDRFVVRANLGGGHLRDEARESRRLTIDGQLENRERGAVLFQQAAQRDPPGLDILLRGGRGQRQPDRRLTPGEGSKPGGKRRVARSALKSNARGERNRERRAPRPPDP